MTDSSPNARQVGGDHYKTAEGPQHWDLMALLGPAWFVGNVTKYASRYKQKNGREDLAKAVHYLDKLVEVHRAGLCYPSPTPLLTPEKFDAWADGKSLDMVARECCRRMFFWRSGSDLTEVRQLLDLMAADAA